MTVETPKDALAALSQGIALLIELAQRGEIDPWDVQVIEVIDRYLSKLTPIEESTQGNNFTELSQSGQAFLYASMLVLLKSESLMATETADNGSEFTEPEELLNPEDDGLGIQRPQNLEHQLRRRAVGKVPQKRRVTLQELIDQLQLMATTIAEQKARRRPRATSSKAKAQTARAIAELAHQENLTETAAQLEQLLLNPNAQLSEDGLELEELVHLWSSIQQQQALTLNGSHPEPHEKHPHSDRVGVFWALLLLSAQSKVELSQEEFYQDIKIKTLNHNGSNGTRESISPSQASQNS